MFNYLVGFATIIVVPFVVMAWWDGRQSHQGKTLNANPAVGAPMPNKRRNLILAALAVVAVLSNWLLLAAHFGLFGGTDFNDQNLTQILNRTYSNATVPLDGFEFVNCTFENVTFQYEGTRTFRLTNVHLIQPGHFSIRTSNHVVIQALQLQTELVKMTGAPVTGELTEP